MKKHIIYIATNANRMYLEANYSTDIAYTYFELRENTKSIFNTTMGLTSIVLLEEFDTAEDAHKRLHQLEFFTRMQKEKLVRRQNPNWLNLGTALQSTPLLTKKAAVQV